jgi:hypothetical protein
MRVDSGLEGNPPYKMKLQDNNKMAIDVIDGRMPVL